MSRTTRRALSPRPPDGVILFYRRALRRILDEIQSALEEILFPRLAQFAQSEKSPFDLRADARDTDETAQRIRDRAKERFEELPIEERINVAATRIARHTEAESARLGISVRDFSPGIDNAIGAFRRRNVLMINSLVGDQLERIEAVLEKGETVSVEVLRKQIQHTFDVTKSKAALLARDQTLKLNAQITRHRHASAGISEYIWTTSGDERVRESHDALDGQRFRYDAPPVVSEDGRTGNPGDDYQCRCTPFPIVPLFDEEAA